MLACAFLVFTVSTPKANVTTRPPSSASHGSRSAWSDRIGKPAAGWSALGKRGRQLAGDAIPQLLGQLVAHAVYQDQTGAPDRAGNRPAAEWPLQLVGAAVQDHGGRGDLPVVAQQAAAGDDRAEMPGDAPRVVAAFVGLDRFGADPLLGRRIAGTADDSPDPHGVVGDHVERRTRRRAVEDREQGAGGRRRQERLVVA